MSHSSLLLNLERVVRRRSAGDAGDAGAIQKTAIKIRIEQQRVMENHASPPESSDNQSKAEAKWREAVLRQVSDDQ